MVVLPTVKLAILFLKTMICKPIANRIKKEAGYHRKFRHFISNIAQANHRITTRVQRRIYGEATDVAIRPLDEEKAVQVAADLLGELFVFTVVGTGVILEVQRNSRSEARKEELRRQELQGMKEKDEDLAKEVEHFKQKLAELEHLARGRGLSGIFNFMHPHDAIEDGKNRT